MTVQEKEFPTKKKQISMVNEDDGELIRKATENRAAFADLYRDHVNKVYRYFMFKVGNHIDAQELTSQTFLAVFESIANYRGEGSFAGWLFGIASRKAAQFYQQKNHRYMELDEEIHDNLPPLDQAIEQNLEFSRVMRALNRLSNDRAEVIRLYFLSGLSTAEVAMIMRKSEPAVRMLIHRSLNDLRNRLE